MTAVLPMLLVGGAVLIAFPVAASRRSRAPGPIRIRNGRSWSRGSAPPFSAALWRDVVLAVERRPRWATGVAMAAVAAVAAPRGGPVAAMLAAAYAGLAGRALIRRSTGRRVAADRARTLDELAALAADLRAGLPPIAADGFLPPGCASAREGRIGRLTSSVWRLAERTGAPAADLVERIEADARAADRAAATAAAQAAGAKATALLLAALPLGGIALGVAIGADPVRVLLHTPVGAACALGATLLQSVGLLWADRLVSGPAGVAR